MAEINADIVACHRCPRLVQWRTTVAVEKRKAFRDDDYWGKPVPSFGDPDARIVVVGLAPAAHGANRTGRMFTGDRSGDWLFRALYRAELCNQPRSTERGDGLELVDTWITATAHCAPPQNRLTAEERLNCGPFLTAEFDALDEARVLVCLGGVAWAAVCDHLGVRPRPRFGHGAEYVVDNVGLGEGRPATLTMLGSYHPSQQNTFTGRLTEEMLDGVFGRAREIVHGSATSQG